MSTKPDGGPAFLVTPDFHTFQPRNVDEYKRLMSGMTLRDYFAAQALPAIIAAYVEANGRCIGAEHFPRNVPLHAYALADAMLEARK